VFACSLEPNQKGKAWISDLTETEEEVISASIRNATEMETYIESVTKNEIKWHFDVGTSKPIRTFFVSNPKTMVFVSGGKMDHLRKGRWPMHHLLIQNRSFLIRLYRGVTAGNSS
jgi:hypothetical protein